MNVISRKAILGYNFDTSEMEPCDLIDYFVKCHPDSLRRPQMIISAMLACIFSKPGQVVGVLYKKDTLHHF
jgi:hypothetical protein